MLSRDWCYPGAGAVQGVALFRGVCCLGVLSGKGWCFPKVVLSGTWMVLSRGIGATQEGGAVQRGAIHNRK